MRIGPVTVRQRTEEAVTSVYEEMAREEIKSTAPATESTLDTAQVQMALDMLLVSYLELLLCFFFAFASFDHILVTFEVETLVTIGKRALDCHVIVELDSL